jgi:hypothetical protein|tara:strand:- start:679 stop:1284 length:606 start_codon:yes stop_codon:yes gene_type:complete
VVVIVCQLIVAFNASNRLTDVWENTGEVMMIKRGKAPEMLDAELRLNVYPSNVASSEYSFNVYLGVDGKDSDILRAMKYGVGEDLYSQSFCNKDMTWEYYGREVNRGLDADFLRNVYYSAVRKVIPGQESYGDYSPIESLTFEYGRDTGTACSDNLLTRHTRDEGFLISRHPNGTLLIAQMQAQHSHSLIYKVVNYFRMKW